MSEELNKSAKPRQREILLLIRKSKDIRTCPQMPFERRIAIGRETVLRMDKILESLDALEVKPSYFYDLLNEKEELSFRIDLLEKESRAVFA